MIGKNWNISIWRNLQIGGVVLGLLLIFFYVNLVSKARFQKRYLEEATNNLVDAESVLLSQKERLFQLDQSINGLQGGALDIRAHNQFIRYLESTCDSFLVSLVSLPLEKQISFGDYKIAEVNLQLEGEFQAILQVLFQIESIDQSAIIHELSIEKETIRQRNRSQSYLVATASLHRLIPE